MVATGGNRSYSGRWPRRRSSELCLREGQGRLPEEVAFELGLEGEASVFKVSQQGVGVGGGVGRGILEAAF